MQNKKAFTIVETLVAVTVVSIVVSLLLESSAQSSFIYDRVTQKQEDIKAASVIIFTQKTDALTSIAEETNVSDIPQPFKLGVRVKEERAPLALQNGANMFLNLKKSVVTLENGDRVEFTRFDKF